MIRLWQRIIGSCLLGWLWGSAAWCGAEPVHMNVQDADAGAVLMSAARLGGYNLILGDAALGKVTLRVEEEPQRIMELVAASQGLLLERYDNVYVVTSPAKNGRNRRVHVYKSRYANPHDLARVANLSLSLAGKSDNLTKDKTDGKSAQVKPADSSNAEKQRVIVDDATESVVFYGTEAEARELDTVLRRLDVPAEQVLLEAKVVALSKNASKDLGIEWEWSKLPNYPEHSKTYHNAGKSNERIDYDTKRSYKGKTGNIPGIIQFGRGPEGYPFEFYFGAKLNALLSDGKADILARPNITTIQGHEAVINIGGDVPVPTQSVTDSTTTTTVTYRQAGIILRCTPRVNANGEITAQVHTEVSTPEFVTDLKAYRFQKRSADTTVRLQDGETMVIGGLIGSEDSRTMSKIPFLGDIPILGAFFKHVQHSHTESEVMIFLKAHVLPKS